MFLIECSQKQRSKIMVKNKTEKLKKLLKTAILYYKVGVKRATFLKAFVMIRYFFLTYLMKRDIPWLIELSVTYRCQLKCVHCSVWKYSASKKKELTNDEIKRVLDQAAEIGIPKIDFFGGEPLLKEGIVDLVAYGSVKGLYMSITTNAWLLTREMTIKLKKAGISCINISLDSISEEKHDELRGQKGAYQKAINGIRDCYEEEIPCIVSTYATKNRAKNFGKGESDDSWLSKMISLSKELKATGIRILFPIISGKWENKKEMEMTEEEKREVIDNLDPSFAFIEGAFSVRNGEKVCQALSGKMLNISPYGDLQICVAFPDAFGNVKDKPLFDLIHNLWSHPIYQKNKNSNCCNTLELIRPGTNGEIQPRPQNVIGC